MNTHAHRPLALALSALLAGAALTACSKPEPPAGEMPPPTTEPAAPADTAPPPADTAPPATDTGVPPPVEGSSNQTPPDQAKTDAKQPPAH